MTEMGFFARTAKSFLRGTDWGRLTQRSREQRDSRLRDLNRLPPFSPAKPPPGVVPEGFATLAMDDNLSTWGANAYWGGGAAGYAFAEGLEFLGYPYLSQLAQRPEYRRIVEVTATEMTRKWIRLEGPDSKTKKLQEEMERLNMQGVFREIAEQDGFFGRGHLYIDTGDGDDPDELKTPIGNGQSALSKRKVSPKKPVLALKPVEALWTYPTNYNSSDPLADDWYSPDMWFVMGKQVHSSRLLRFIGREVPDLLKPAYSFGGLSLTQMAKPYVTNWLETRQSVNDIVSAYSQQILMTDMSQDLQEGGELLFKRLDLFNELRNNRGVMALDKDNEDFKNVSTPLSGLHELQAQAQEHMAAVSGIPLVKLLGIQPAGLNASSEGELRSFYDWIAASQQSLMRAGVHIVLCFLQLSLFGKVDPNITFQFVSLFALDELQQATLEKTRAESDQIRIDTGVLSPEDVRENIATRADTPYPGIDPNDVPDMQAEEMMGLEPEGGRPQPLTEKAAEAEGDVKDDGDDKGATDMALDGDWEEAKHPRANNGEFGQGGGSTQGHGMGQSFMDAMREVSEGATAKTSMAPVSAGYNSGAEFQPASPGRVTIGKAPAEGSQKLHGYGSGEVHEEDVGPYSVKWKPRHYLNGDRVDTHIEGVQVAKDGRKVDLNSLPSGEQKLILDRVLADSKVGAENHAEEESLGREWSAMTKQQRAAYKTDEAEQQTAKQEARAAAIHKDVGEALAGGWKPTRRKDGSWSLAGAPASVTQYASPSSEALVRQRLNEAIGDGNGNG